MILPLFLSRFSISRKVGEVNIKKFPDGFFSGELQLPSSYLSLHFFVKSQTLLCVNWKNQSRICSIWFSLTGIFRARIFTDFFQFFKPHAAIFHFYSKASSGVMMADVLVFA